MSAALATDGAVTPFPQAEAGRAASHRRFVLAFAFVFGGLTFGGAALAALADPTLTFGTGLIQTILTPEDDVKPPALLAMKPGPGVIIVGSSRVMKLKPACVRELTGMPAFNLGLSNSTVEGWNAAFRFASDHAPLRRMIIAVDVEGFDPHAAVDPRLLASKHLRQYMDEKPRLRWESATRALFGMQNLRFTFTSLRMHFFPPPKMRAMTVFGDDGLVTYPGWEEQQRLGTLPREQLLAAARQTLENQLWKGNFTELSPPRVTLFRQMMRLAQERGIEVDAYISLLSPEIGPVAAAAQVAARRAELDRLLAKLDSEGLLLYHRYTRVEDFGGDPREFFDGFHMTEANTSRLLLSMFNRQSGCGVPPGSSDHERSAGPEQLNAPEQ